MRALFLVALLLNVAFLYWQYTREPAATGILPAIAPGVGQLRLVEEAEDTAAGQQLSGLDQEADSDGQAEKDSAARTAVKAEPLKPAPPCLVAGPIVKKQLADQLADRISRSTGVTVLNRQVVVQIQQYWIYLASAASLSEAQRLADALGAHGLKDYQILASPGKKNAISLGLFNEKESAQRRFEHIRDLGYTPHIDVIDRTAKRHELLIRPEQGELMSPARIRPFLPKDLTIGLRRDICE